MKKLVGDGRRRKTSRPSPGRSSGRPSSPAFSSAQATLLNRFLALRSGLKVAVLENEFGTVGIDGGLVAESSAVEVVELTEAAASAACAASCSDALAGLANRRERGELDFDHLVMRTTRLADPGATCGLLPRQRRGRPLHP